MRTKPAAQKRGRQHVSSLIRTLAWEWVKFNHPQVANKIKTVAYEECGLKPPKPNAVAEEVLVLLRKI